MKHDISCTGIPPLKGKVSNWLGTYLHCVWHMPVRQTGAVKKIRSFSIFRLVHTGRVKRSSIGQFLCTRNLCSVRKFSILLRKRMRLRKSERAFCSSAHFCCTRTRQTHVVWISLRKDKFYLSMIAVQQYVEEAITPHDVIRKFLHNKYPTK